MWQEVFLIIKWEEFTALIGLITYTDFNRFEVSDNRFQNLSRFPAIIITLRKEVISLPMLQYLTGI